MAEPVQRWHKARTSGTAPTPRWGHSAVSVGSTLVVFGGYDGSYMNDVWFLDCQTMAWSQPQIAGVAPSLRSNHTACMDRTGSRMIIFGGGGSIRARNNDVFALDFPLMTWIKPAVTGRVPSPRTYHSAVMIQDLMVVFAGEGDKDLEELHVLDVTTYKWLTPRIKGTAPTARRFHTASAIGSKMFVFAGCYRTYRCVSELYVLDVSDYNPQTNHGSMVWTMPTVHGVVPKERWGHTSFVFGTNMFIFGGRCGYDLNDMCVLDSETCTWYRVSTGGSIPTPRRRHTSTFVNRTLITFGGFDGHYFNDVFTLDIIAEPPIQLDPCTLSADFRAILHDTSFSDVRFKVEGQIMSAHRVMLASRSGQFKRALPGGRELVPPMAGREVTVTNVQHNVFQRFLEFLYTGAVQDALSAFELEELKSVAKNYEIQTLSDLCTKARTVIRNGSNSKVFIQLTRRSGNRTAAGTDDLLHRPLRATADVDELSTDDLTRTDRSVSLPIRVPSDIRIAVTSSLRSESISAGSVGSAMNQLGVCVTNPESQDTMLRLSQSVVWLFDTAKDSASLPLSSTLDEFSDVSFVVEGQAIRAHRSVLCARSQYFEAMLQKSGMRETQEPEIPVHDVPYKVFWLVIQYLYEGEIKLDVETAIEMIVAANLFGLESLVKICERALKDAVTVENVCELLLHADCYGAQQLREFCIFFIAKRFGNFSRLDSFESLAHTDVGPILVAEILKVRSLLTVANGSPPSTVPFIDGALQDVSEANNALQDSVLNKRSASGVESFSVESTSARDASRVVLPAYRCPCLLM
eukprot:GILJ01005778.1.p1 GENE.GILJ01005778.1~~GILJ01005778.1.p1  ORF type:complete len:803 (-),score=109.40 GILJ01005778.1:84-2492(-)